MQNEQQLDASYRDLLDGSADPELLRLVDRLGRDLALVYLDGEVPQAMRGAIDQAVYAHQQAGSKDRLHQWRRAFAGFPYRLRITTAAILVVLCLAGAGYAMLPGLREVFQLHTGTAAILDRHLGRAVTLVQTRDGFTVTVKHVYADANQIVIGYTITVPEGRTFNNTMGWGEFDLTPGHEKARSPILTDKHGNEFNRGLGGIQPGIQNGVAAVLLTYDGVGITNTDPDLQVRLTIGKLSAYERLGENTFRDIMVDGPFIFDLTIPIEHGRGADLHLRSISSGTVVTLERIVTTPTGTRISLRGVGPNAHVELTIAGATFPLQPPDGMAMPNQWSADSQWEYITGTSFQAMHGEWLLVVKPGGPAGLGPADARVTGGPWTFRFIVP